MRFEGRFGFDTNNTNEISRKKMPQTWRAETFSNTDGEITFKEQRTEEKMTQSSFSTGTGLNFRSNFTLQSCIQSASRRCTLKYSQDAYRTTVDIGTDIKNGIAKRHMGLAGRASYNWNYRYFIDFNFGYNGSENLCRWTSIRILPRFFSGLEHCRREIH